jgi:hypothetical protein|tara:strand:- start:215 stop:373 length:159 start_codon:yes stop_codon:yes gene_type:complete
VVAVEADIMEVAAVLVDIEQEQLLSLVLLVLQLLSEAEETVDMVQELVDWDT